MLFVIQKEMSETGYDVDIILLKQVLQRRRILDSADEISLEEMTRCPADSLRDFIPVGSIQFVETWLNRCHGIDRINPIEIPKFLRTKEFVKRDYQIVPFDRLPNGKDFFVKDVTALKRFVYFGDPACLREERYAAAAPRDHLYQVSEIVDVISEYRVYVIGGEIENVCLYNGSPLIQPDIGLIEKANALYKKRPDYPGSLTIDVMVSGKYGTELIEVHPFISVGLYSTLWGDNLVYAYRDGIKYVLRHNTKLEV